VAVIAVARRPSTVAPDGVVRYVVDLAPGEQLATPLYGATATLGIAPDGRAIAYSLSDGSGSHLEVQGVDELRGRALEGGQGGLLPEFSPDGKWIAFVSNDYKLKKARVSGGPAVTLCDYAEPAGLAVLSNEAIVLPRRTRSTARATTAKSRSSTPPSPCWAAPSCCRATACTWARTTASRTTSPAIGR